jgi:hypothetical protein
LLSMGKCDQDRWVMATAVQQHAKVKTHRRVRQCTLEWLWD